MTTRTFQFATHEFYHVYNRGVDKRVIYSNSTDYRRFTELLYVANTTDSTNLRVIKRGRKNIYQWDRGEALVAIGAYCLMPNHFHILLTPLQENGVSAFMNKLGTSYAMYFNNKYQRTGSLFEGKFKAKHAASDEYLKYLFSYIHLNPVKLSQPNWKEVGINDTKKAFEFATNYRYSSLCDYQREVRPESAIIRPSSFPDYFLTAANRQTELMQWLQLE